jgi:hypothetical protein
MIKVGTFVKHADRPGVIGQVLAKTKRWGNETPIVLVKWDGTDGLSRHIPSALTEVK